MLNSDIYQFKSYKQFVIEAIENNPDLGRGSVKKIADFLRVHSSLISQILRGTKDFNPEQANEIAQFLGLDDRATDYFLCLVNIERAGSYKLKSFLEKKRDEMILTARRESNSAEALIGRVSKENIDRLNSNWLYCAIWLLSQMPKYQSVALISQYLKLPATSIKEVLEGLRQLGLVTVNSDDTVRCEFSLSDSNIIDPVRFHMNWRVKALARLSNHDSREDFITVPVALTANDRNRLRQMIREFAIQIRQSSEPSIAEDLSVMTIDFFDIA